MNSRIQSGLQDSARTSAAGRLGALLVDPPTKREDSPTGQEGEPGPRPLPPLAGYSPAPDNVEVPARLVPAHR